MFAATTYERSNERASREQLYSVFSFLASASPGQHTYVRPAGVQKKRAGKKMEGSGIKKTHPPSLRFLPPHFKLKCTYMPPMQFLIYDEYKIGPNRLRLPISEPDSAFLPPIAIKLSPYLRVWRGGDGGRGGFCLRARRKKVSHKNSGRVSPVRERTFYSPN